MDHPSPKQVRFRADRIIVPLDGEANPELEPLFANHFELARLNSDVYLDIGIIPPFEMLQAVQEYKPGDEPVGVKFYVLQRVAMTPETLDRLRIKINEIAENQQKGVMAIADTEAAPKKAKP